MRVWLSSQSYPPEPPFTYNVPMDRNTANEGFPRAVMHIDGDSFFVSCELTRRPWLQGRPAVTGQERGMATAVNYEAKALGVVRGMRTAMIRRNYPSVVILPSDYRLYAQYAQRMYAIVRRYAEEVEEYSIDECFALLRPGTGERAGQSYEETARAIQADLHRSLGITFSVGVGVNKVTAKIASKWRKPAGLTMMPLDSIPAYLRDLPIGKVWGIGSATTVRLRKLGIVTAQDLATKDRAWVAEHCDKPLGEIYEELRGNSVKELSIEGRDPSSVQRVRTFYPATRDRAFLWSQLSYHAEDACMRLRGKGLAAGRASLSLKTQDFQYLRAEAVLPDPSAAPEEILRALEPVFDRMWRETDRGVMFRAAGISLHALRPADQAEQGLFAAPARHTGARLVHAAADRLARKFGKHSIFLGSSFKAMKRGGDLEEPTGTARAWDVIYLGEVV